MTVGSGAETALAEKLPPSIEIVQCEAHQPLRLSFGTRPALG